MTTHGTSSLHYYSLRGEKTKTNGEHTHIYTPTNGYEDMFGAGTGINTDRRVERREKPGTYEGIVKVDRTRDRGGDANE